jgi:NAD(P)-dependent dehydrogenase (short-subunit alcohol dehydrogenase family)
MTGVVMISGAARGIGRAITDRLASDGYTLSLGVRRPDEVAATFAAIDPARIMLHPFEATDRASGAAWVDATVKRFGRIDALVNNAGILRVVDFDQGDDAALDEIWAVNVKAPFHLIREAMPHLRKGGHGRVINIASTDGKRYRQGTSVAYAMTKHAVLALSHAARFAGWEDGVRVTALCPGAVDTDLIADIPGVTPKADRIKPATIADTVAFLLTLPNTASVAEMVMNTRLESGL